MKDVVAYCRVACAKESDPSAEVQLQEQMVRRYADARGHFAWPQRGKWVVTRLFARKTLRPLDPQLRKSGECPQRNARSQADSAYGRFRR